MAQHSRERQVPGVRQAAGEGQPVSGRRSAESSCGPDRSSSAAQPVSPGSGLMLYILPILSMSIHSVLTVYAEDVNSYHIWIYPPLIMSTCFHIK